MYDVLFNVSMVIDDLEDLLCLLSALTSVKVVAEEESKLSPPTVTAKGDPLTFLPLYLTVT
jgi:hypothetical protein